MNDKRAAIYVMLCEPHVELWLNQFLKNASYNMIPIGWHLDHCSDETKAKIHGFSLTVSVYEEDNEKYLERFRSRPFHALQRQGYEWIGYLDIDETLEDGEQFMKDIDTANKDGFLSVKESMFTVWEHDSKLMLRTDTFFKPDSLSSQTARDRIYKGSCQWEWLDPITVGCTLIKDGKPDEKTPIYNGLAKVLHWGYSTKELREAHRKTWDENYTRAIGRNPYNLWNYICDESIPITLEEFNKYNFNEKRYN